MNFNTKETYKLNYNGLPVGIHVFEYQLKGEFFQQFEKSAIENASLEVKILFNIKNERLFELEFDISGELMLQCDRCLETFVHNIDINEVLFVKLGAKYIEEAENSIVWPESKAQLDLASHIYDYVELSIPFQKVHPLDENGMDTCNIEMLEKLDEYLIENQNNNGKEDETDPRWDKLKDFLN